MSDHAAPLEPMGERAAELVAAGDWSGLHAELAGLDAGRVLASTVLAYRFGEALYHTGRMPELASFADAYARESRAAADTLGLLRALNLSGIAAFELGEIDTAESRWEELLDLADGSGEQDMLARAANNLGAVANLRGRSTQAVVFYRLALLLYQRLDQTRGLAQTYHNLAMSLRDVGRYDDAISAFNRAIEVAERIGYRPVVAMTLISRAELEVRRGDYAVGAELAARGLELARQLEDPISTGEAIRVLGTARGLGGDREVGLGHLEAALASAREMGNKLLEAETLRDLGQIEIASGAGVRAEERFERALACFEELGASGEAERLRARLTSH